jgi:hypothetical protein
LTTSSTSSLNDIPRLPFPLGETTGNILGIKTKLTYNLEHSLKQPGTETMSRQLILVTDILGQELDGWVPGRMIRVKKMAGWELEELYMKLLICKVEED